MADLDLFGRGRRYCVLLFILLGSFLLSGCLLVSGEQTTIDLLENAGNLNTTFVSAEGHTERTIQVNSGATTLQVIVVVTVESGDLQIDLLQPDGTLAFIATSQPDTQITRSSQVRSDDQGRVRYQVWAHGVRNGTYQIFFQP